MNKTCPREEILVDYVEDRLPEEERLDLEEHLSVCDSCLEDLIVANTVFREGEEFELDSVPKKVTKSAVRALRSQYGEPSDAFPEKLKKATGELWVKVLDSFSVTSRAGLQLAPIRGSKTRLAKDLIHLTKTFKDLEVEIEIEK